MEEALSDLKKVLRSLVVSSPVQVDVRSLLKDYREMVGGRLPIEQYGYRDPIMFLKERCSDSFQFQGSPNNPILNLIVTDSIKHIDRFVRSQKISPAAKAKGKRRSVLGTPSCPAVSASKPSREDLIFRSFKNNNGWVPNAVGTNSHPPRIPIDNRNHYKDQSDNRIEERKVKEDKSKERKAKSAPVYNDLDGCTSSSSGSLSRLQALSQVKANIKEIVSLYPEGVWCAALLALYKERFGTELNFNKYGFTSLVSLVLQVGDEIAVTRPNPSDWLLQPASAVACQPKLPQDPQMQYVPWAVRRLAAPQSDEDALPGVAIEPGVFPADCVEPLASIEGVGVEGVAEGDLLEVMVTELYSPSRFWVQRLGDRHNLALEELMDEMNLYYGGAGAQRRLSVGAVRVGHHVACRFERDWHRAVIVRLLHAGSVKVRHVDYGTVCDVRAAELRPLLRRFAALPVQAIRAALAGVRPAAGGRRWPLAASSFLLTQVSERQLVARLCAVCSASATLELQLIDTSGEDDVYLAERLLRAGHADPEPRSALASDECYLLPTFDALEGGHTLNFHDIHQCLRHGIDIEFLDEYRCHVAPLVPSSPPTSPPPTFTSPPPTPPVSPPRADAPLLSVVPLQLPLSLSISSPPLPAPTPSQTPVAPPERGLAPEVYKRFLALSMVDSTLANEYMVDEIMRAQAQVDSRSPDPAWSSSPVPSLGWNSGPVPAWNSSPVPAWSPSPSHGWSSGPVPDPAWHGSYAPRSPWSLTFPIRPPPGFEPKPGSTSGPTKWV